jgi:hypothetical protein
MKGKHMTRSIRPIRVVGDIAIVPLTQGKEAIIDACDVHLVEGVNWYAMENRNTFYAQRVLRTGPNKKTTIKMHRVITSADSGLEIDHKDGNGLNNRRSNMRIATRSQNSRNRGKHSNNKSGFKGVSWNTRDRTWQAQITKDHKKIHLGNFPTPEQAHAAYRAAAAKLHGDFACTE